MAGKRTVIKVNGVSLDQIDDEVMLTDLLNSSEDTETRKILRARLQQIKSAGKAKREMRIDNIEDARENAIQQRQKEAAQSKARTLAMYDNMAKSGNAGDKRQLDINTYSGRDTSGKLMVSGTALQSRDFVEETIRERVRASEENKKRLLAAFDYAAKTQPSGTVRDVDLAAFQGVDVSSFETEKPSNAATFRSSNGVPQVVKVNQSAPSTPQIDIKKAPSFTQEQPHLDAYERALRQRKQEADERKARTLAGYDAIARSGVCGPKIVVREELEHMENDLVGPSKRESSKLTKYPMKCRCCQPCKLIPISTDASPTSSCRPANKTSPIKGRPTNPKDALLHWCYMKTRNYENVYVENFSSSWADGLAFCALLHHFFPNDIEYAKLSSQTRRENFDLAFKLAEDKAKVYPLLETNDMIKMGDKPDWKCVYTYVQALYKGLKPLDPTQK